MWFNGCGLGVVNYDLGKNGGCGQCPGTCFQKVGAYASDSDNVPKILNPLSVKAFDISHMY